MNVDAFVEPVKHPHDLINTSLHNRVHSYKADFVSFQFVPYAYAHRGLVSRWTLPWRSLRGIVGTHVMFHEIWIGAQCGAPWRQRAVGFLQRLGIKSMIRELEPSTIHCTNRLYSVMLQGAEVPNRLLPLFSNVPVLPAGLDPYEALVSSIAPGVDRSGWDVAALFGRIHQSDNILPAIQWLNRLSRSQGKRLLIVSLGNCPSVSSTFKQLEQHFRDYSAPTFFAKGPLSTHQLSNWIIHADCAISTTPLNIIDKSSSVAAFVDHGIPVIVLDPGIGVRSITYNAGDLAPAFWLFGDPRLDSWVSLPKRRAPQHRLPIVAQQFLNDLIGGSQHY